MLQRPHTSEGEPRPRPIDVCRRTVLLAALGGVGLFAVDSNIGQQQVAAQPTLDMGALLEQTSSSSQNIPVPESNVDKPKLTSADSMPDECTSIRRRAKDFYNGLACVKNGDKFTRIREYPKEKGWVYGVVAVKGWEKVKSQDGGIQTIRRTYHKCGYVQEGVLPYTPPRPRSVTHCKNYFTDLVIKRNVYFVDINCPEIKPGLEGCDDGTFYSPHSGKSDSKDTYENYASDEPSPFNVFGTGDGGFNGKIDDNIQNFLHFRAEIRIQSKEGRPIIIRGLKKWALAPDEYVNQKDRRGGPCTDKRRTRNHLGQKVCGKL